MSLNKVNKNMIDSSYMPSAFVGSIISIFATDTYIPNGCLKPDGMEYVREQFSSFYDNFLVTGKLLTCTYAAHAAQIALSGNCAMFGLDQTNKKFKVPFIKDGDIISHANNAAELGKSYKAGLPDIQGTTGSVEYLSKNASGAFYNIGSTSDSTYGNNASRSLASLGLKASLYNSIYGNSTTVTPEQIRLRHFVVIASAQNVESTINWANYVASLNSKANGDMDNLTTVGKHNIAKVTSPTRKYARRINIAWPQGIASTTGMFYSAPAAGHVCITLQVVSGSWYSLVGASDEDPTKCTVGACDAFTAPAGNIRANIEVAEGQQINIAYAAPTLSELYFTPKEGA